MRKTLTKVLIALSSIIIVGMILVILLTLFYRKTFALNTWINGYYCTGLTVDDINQHLIDTTEIPDVVILSMNADPIVIPAEKIGLRPDYASSVRKIMKTRSNYDWTKNLSKGYNVTLTPDSYWWDRDKMEEIFDSLSFVKSERETSDSTYVYYDGDKGYQLYDGKYDRLNTAEALALINTQLSEGKFEIDLITEGCYEDHEDSKEDSRQRLLWEKLQAYYQRDFVYDMGAEQIAFDSKLLSSFLQKDLNGMPALDVSGNLIVSEELVNQWLDLLGEAYNTAGTTRDFQTTEGRVIQVAYNNYGTLLDIEAEKAYLYPAIMEKVNEVHKPVYIQEGYYRGQDDIGPTYIEVDMGEQRMYFYQDGEQKIATDVVTGNLRTKSNTPTGINYIEYMQRNRVLVGPNYRTPVKYWIRVVGHIGIHDATWRDEFGGDIYLTNGSHGCVNTPMDDVSALYEMVEVGIPVVMFY